MQNYGQLLRKLALAAGLNPDWQSLDGGWHSVSPDTLRQVLAALGLPGRSTRQISAALDMLSQQSKSSLPPFLTATAGTQLRLPCPSRRPGQASIIFEGNHREHALAIHLEEGTLSFRVPSRIGYHRLQIGRAESILAIAPPQGKRCADLTDGSRAWGISSQIYGLRRAGDGGVGDFSALAILGRCAAAAGAAALAISPLHAQFSADSNHFSPYSPSNRLWLNILYVDPEAAWTMIAPGHAGPDTHRDRRADRLIDWPAVAKRKLSDLRALHDHCLRHSLLSAAHPIGSDFLAFCRQGGAALAQHALFEALQAHFLRQSPALWHWRNWPAAYRRPDSPACRQFAAGHADEISFHSFAQWLAACQLDDAARRCRADMQIGLICDIAVGSDSGGSQNWADRRNMLDGLSIGAPPDDFNAGGQNWGITSFAPNQLPREHYRPFIDLLRASLRYGGGVRMDHILGLQRLWVIPEGAAATDGVYLNYPLDDLLRITALESKRAQAFILGEDLGTVPEQFRPRLREAGISGMQVLWFQRAEGDFLAASAWDSNAVGMTTTHDLPTIAGWWTGTDLRWRRRLAQQGTAGIDHTVSKRRQAERGRLWSRFTQEGVASGPQPGKNEPQRVIDSAIAFLGRTGCDLVLLPLEDLLALTEQPNLPGTIDEHPNWRRRLAEDVGNIFSNRVVKKRLLRLDHQRRKR